MTVQEATSILVAFGFVEHRQHVLQLLVGEESEGLSLAPSAATVTASLVHHGGNPPRFNWELKVETGNISNAADSITASEELGRNVNTAAVVARAVDAMIGTSSWAVEEVYPQDR